MVGGDLPGWLPSLFRRAGATALTDRRGECVYAGCPHYRRCFIERAARASQDADLVIANHALVMVNAARGAARTRRPGSCSTRAIICSTPPISTFAAAFTGQEAIELRRWIVGPEGKARGRRRGLAARLMDVASYDEAGALALDAAVQMAGALPGDGWLQRIAEGAPFGPVEALLAAVRCTVYARATAQDAGYGLETELAEPDPRLVEAAAPAVEALERCSGPWSRSANGSRRCSRMRPTGSTPRRARGSRARSAASPGGAGAAGLDRAAGADRRAGRSRFRRLARGRSGRGPRI